MKIDIYKGFDLILSRKYTKDGKPPKTAAVQVCKGKQILKQIRFDNEKNVIMNLFNASNKARKWIDQNPNK